MRLFSRGSRGESSKGKSSAEEWGRDEEVKKPLSDANCFKCGAAGHWARDCPTNNKPEADKPEEEEFPARECEKGCGPLSIRTARSEQNSGRKYYKSARGVLLYLRLARVVAMASRTPSTRNDATRFPQVRLVRRFARRSDVVVASSVLAEFDRRILLLICRRPV